MKLLIKKLSDDAIMPQFAHPGDAGMDLFAIAEVTLAPGEAALIKTGLSIQLPINTEAQIRPRSGLALKHTITVLNAPGTIDEGYRGEIGIILINHGKKGFLVTKGMKVAQMVIKPTLSITIEETDELIDTKRGAGGFGSTGR